MEEPLAQVSSASLQQKWKYESYKVSIAPERLLENETQVYNGLINSNVGYLLEEFLGYGYLIWGTISRTVGSF